MSPSRRELSDVTRMSIAVGAAPAPPGYTGPLTADAFLTAIAKKGEHGGDFVYSHAQHHGARLGPRTPHRPIHRPQISPRYWSKLGMEHDASIQVDRIGTGFWGGGMSATPARHGALR